MERVLAVRVDADLDARSRGRAHDWLPSQEDAAPTERSGSGISPAGGSRPSSGRERRPGSAFQEMAGQFARELDKVLDAERRRLDAWLKERSEEICGKPRDEGPTLFDRVAADPGPRSPAERLQEFIRRPGRRVEAPVRSRERAPIPRAGPWPSSRSGADSASPSGCRSGS